MQYGRGRVATQIEITVLSFQTTDTSCQTYWRISDENGNQLEEGNTELPELIYSEWGQLNTFIEDYILEQLNLERL